MAFSTMGPIGGAVLFHLVQTVQRHKIISNSPTHRRTFVSGCGEGSKDGIHEVKPVVQLLLME